MNENHRRPWLDATVNVQSMLLAALAAVGGAVVAWYSLVGEVATLKQHDIEQDARATRIEQSIEQQRTDTKSQLQDISGDVKDIRNYLMTNSAAIRPDTRRWSK